MTSRQFVVRTLAVTLTLSALVGFVNWRVNLYGLYGNVKGQERAPISNERWSKYLYAFNQIPSNYDSLLIGSSLSANLDTAKLHGLRMYNLSMTGANVAEEAALAEQALVHGRYRVVVFCLYPYLLKDHEFKAGRTEPRNYFSGFGSLPLIEDYLVAMAIHWHLFAPRFSASGAQDMDAAGGRPVDADEGLRIELSKMAGPAHLKIDPEALAQLRRLVRLFRASGAKIVIYLPPVYGPRYSVLRTVLEQFKQQVLPVFEPSDPVLDFNDGTLAAFVADPKNFFDGIHFNREGSEKLVRVFDTRLQRALAKFGR